MTSADTALALRTRGAEVSLDGVSRRYGQVQALDEVSLHIPPGQFTVMLGPSGSGKTTLLRAVAGIDTIDAGRIAIDQRTVSDPKTFVPPNRRNLAMVFQDYALWPHMTVRENVGYALGRLRIDRAAAAQRITDALDRVGLSDKIDRYPNELSGGQQQRVALARSLVANPSLLLFDEPLSNLDADLRERMRIRIATLVGDVGATALYITHDQGEAFALADTVAVLDRGRVVQVGGPEEIYAMPATRFVARFTGRALSTTGSISRIEGARAEVSVSGVHLPVTAVGSLGRGDQVDVVVRPTALRLFAVTDQPSRPGAVPAVVADSAYRGAGYDHVVDSPIGRITGVRDPLPHPRGSERIVGIDPAGAFAYPRSNDG